MELFINITLDGIANGMIFAALGSRPCPDLPGDADRQLRPGAMGMMTTFIASTLLGRGRVLVGVPGGPRDRIRLGGAGRAGADPPPAGEVRAQPRHRHHRPPRRPRGHRGSHLRQLQPRVPGRVLPERALGRAHQIAFSHFDVFILVAVLALMTATLVLVSGHHSRPAHAGVRLCRGDLPPARRARRVVAHPGLGLGGRGGIFVGAPGGADELVQPLFHGPRPRLRLHRRGHRRAREPRGCP